MPLLDHKGPQLVPPESTEGALHNSVAYLRTTLNVMMDVVDLPYGYRGPKTISRLRIRETTHLSEEEDPIELCNGIQSVSVCTIAGACSNGERIIESHTNPPRLLGGHVSR